MVDFVTDLVVFGPFSVVFAEIYFRVKVRLVVRRATRALQALARDEDTHDARLLRNAFKAFLGALAGLLLEQGDDGKWHLTKAARKYGAIALGAVGELVKVPAGGAPPAVGTLLGAAGLDVEQLVGLGISTLPKKHQGIAAIAYGLLKPFLGWIAPQTAGKKTSTKESENPFLKDLKT